MDVSDVGIYTAPPDGPEFRLVAAALAADFDEAARERLVVHARERLDWDRLTALILQHEVAPLVHRNLQEYCRDAPLSADFMRTIAREAERQSDWTSELAHEALRVSEALRRNGIDVVFPKGIALCAIAARRYGRCMGDIDALVDDDHLLSALAVLGEMGYVLTREPDFGGNGLLNVWEAEPDEILSRPGPVDCLARTLPSGGRSTIDLNTTRRHFELFLVDLGEVMRDARQLPMGEGTISVPCHEDAIAILSDHLRGHGLIPTGGHRLSLRDAGGLYRMISMCGPALDWARVFDKVSRYSAAHRSAWCQLESEAKHVASSRDVSCRWTAPPYCDPGLGFALSLKAVAVLYGPGLLPEIGGRVVPAAGWLENACEVWTSSEFVIYEWTGSCVERMALDAAAPPGAVWQAGLLRERARMPGWLDSFLFSIGTPSRVREPARRAH